MLWLKKWNKPRFTTATRLINLDTCCDISLLLSKEKVSPLPSPGAITTLVAQCGLFSEEQTMVEAFSACQEQCVCITGTFLPVTNSVTPKHPLACATVGTGIVQRAQAMLEQGAAGTGRCGQRSWDFEQVTKCLPGWEDTRGFQPLSSLDEDNSNHFLSEENETVYFLQHAGHPTTSL